MDNDSYTDSYQFHTDVCVIGAGHAGCEAALACARLGLDTVVFTMNTDSIAMMPCNPHIGGSSKGHLVREIDALGGEMGKAIDHTFLQSRMLNKSKGPAVHSLRAQADKSAYSQYMRSALEHEDHLLIRQDEVVDLITDPFVRGSLSEDYNSNLHNDNSLYQYRISGLRTDTGSIYWCKAVIICTGTYLNARCLIGECIKETGPSGMQRSTFLSKCLRGLGFTIRRFKTGTPARMDGRSIDYSKMTIQPGDDYVEPFSYSTDPESIQPEHVSQVPCWLTYTSHDTHQIIRDNLHRSPIYSGMIEGVGPRYCPSIEDKVVRFPDKDRHQVFIEPEGRNTNLIYVDGMSSSMPDDVQQKMYRTIPGLEHCQIVKNAYAIEYDCLNANELQLTLETKRVNGLFCAGQINGSSGYEEAAAQGLIAGINAALILNNREPLVLKRSEAYIGVLIDDLVTKDNREPYRMMTSRAEYRLQLRQDNADLRLREYGYRVGLISPLQYEKVCRKKQFIRCEIDRLHNTRVGAGPQIQQYLISIGSSPLKTAASLAELLSRPEMTYDMLRTIDPGRNNSDNLDNYIVSLLPADFFLSKEYKEAVTQIEIQIKYQGYIDRQSKQIQEFNRLESRRIPDDIDYDHVPSLRLEARQKLRLIRPVSIGQASRLAGVTPADISVLLIYLERYKSS